MSTFSFDDIVNDLEVDTKEWLENICTMDKEDKTRCVELLCELSWSALHTKIELDDMEDDLLLICPHDLEDEEDEDEEDTKE